MWKAIEEVKEGRCDAVVSAGNTGALMAISKLQLRPMEGVTRPAIATFLPTAQRQVCMLDLGANIECDAENLVQFGIMGAAFSRSILGLKNPSIGLLNVGEEDQKGHNYLREAADILSNPDYGMNYQGFVEGTDITKGAIDVVVTDGFTGNVALKTAEGTAMLITDLLKKAVVLYFNNTKRIHPTPKSCVQKQLCVSKAQITRIVFKHQLASENTLVFKTAQ